MSLVSVDVRESVATITLNDPDRRNAVTLAMCDEVGDALDRLEADPEVKALVVTGAGSAFCAGADLTHLGDSQEEGLLAMARQLIDAGANVQQQDASGWSALHAAASHGFHDVAKLLMDSGCSRRVRDINGLSPVDLAMDNAHDALVDLFIQRS